MDDGLDGAAEDAGDDSVDDSVDESAEETAEARPVDRFRQTAAGAVIAAGLFGLRDALEGRPEREEVSIVNEAPTGKVEPGFRLEFDEDAGVVKVVLPEPPPPDDYQR